MDGVICALKASQTRKRRFWLFKPQILFNQKLETSEIGNMDETPVWFEMSGKSTLAERGEKEVRVATIEFVKPAK
jgi:hypothetical protein